MPNPEQLSTEVGPEQDKLFLEEENEYTKVTCSWDKGEGQYVLHIETTQTDSGPEELQADVLVSDNEHIARHAFDSVMEKSETDTLLSSLKEVAERTTENLTTRPEDFKFDPETGFRSDEE